MTMNPQSMSLIPAAQANELASSLTEGDLEFLIRQTRTRINLEQKNEARRKRNLRGVDLADHERDANKFKIERARDLERRLIAALGREPRNSNGGRRGRA